MTSVEQLQEGLDQCREWKKCRELLQSYTAKKEDYEYAIIMRNSWIQRNYRKFNPQSDKISFSDIKTWSDHCYLDFLLQRIYFKKSRRLSTFFKKRWIKLGLPGNLRYGYSSPIAKFRILRTVFGHNTMQPTQGSVVLVCNVPGDVP